MPELPEVETVVCAIRPKLKGLELKSCRIFKGYNRVIKPDSINSLRRKLAGKKIIAVKRRAKYIILELSNQTYIVVHLRMTGNIQLNEKPSRYATFELSFQSQREKFYLDDVRKFGTVSFHQNLNFLDQKLGIEPLSRNFTKENWRKVCTSSSLGAKAFLLNQSKIAGLGNIYVDESLWAAKVHPLQPIHQLSTRQSNRLFKVIPEILQKSIKYQGTTFINFYFEGAQSKKQAGNFQKMLKVFNKTGQKCSRCSGKSLAKIVKIKVAGRGTHFCPQCQKLSVKN